jgi:hypothetical protein
MNINQNAFSRKCFSIKEDDTTRVIYQNSLELHQHQMDNSYLILSKNDFGKVKKRINVGIFNKKTNFIIGEKNSLLFWDNQELKIISPDINEVLKEPKRYFMFYDMNFITEFNNILLSVRDKIKGEALELKLTRQFGADIGKFLKQSDPQTVEIPPEFEILKSIIIVENGKISINKQVLINSNYNFLIGILEGYLQNDYQFILKSNFNIYNITYILNLLGAQYSIRSIPNNEKQIKFKLPSFLKESSSLSDVFFRKYKYYFIDKKLVLQHVSNIDKFIDINNTEIFNLVNMGVIEMIPVRDLVFIKQEAPMTGYDLTMEHKDATNYSLPGLPFMKNSDGDVLGAIAIMTKDAAEECIRKFSVEMKVNFLNLADASVNNWGVKLDSQLGLFTATK